MDTRSTLLTSAERLMRQRGYDAVSFGDLAKEIGIKTASIHYHFPKKADLAAHLLGQYAKALAQERQRIADDAPTGGAEITEIIALYRRALNQGQQLCLCVAFSAGRDMLDPEALVLLSQFHNDSLEWLSAAFARAQKDGSMQGITDPKTEAAACLALLEGAQLIARAAKDLGPYDRATRALTQRIT